MSVPHLLEVVEQGVAKVGRELRDGAPKTGACSTPKGYSEGEKGQRAKDGNAFQGRGGRQMESAIC
jgi:hypothetical protein